MVSKKKLRIVIATVVFVFLLGTTIAGLVRKMYIRILQALNQSLDNSAGNQAIAIFIAFLILLPFIGAIIWLVNFARKKGWLKSLVSITLKLLK